MKKPVLLAVLVASLGYFVDIYDLLLFSIVRKTSLMDLGLSPSDITQKGLLLLNMQMAGMLIGGVFFGIMGDKKGRLSILLSSILLYSLANVANGFVHTIEAYATLRFIAGLGLAGELGAGISLVSELLPQRTRGYGTMMIAGVGVCGAIVAYCVASHFSWRTSYCIGGGMGLCLLALRVSIHESRLFSQMAHHSDAHIQPGNFLSLFSQRDRCKRYFTCILIGIQFWCTVGISITLAPEFAKLLGVLAPIEGGRAILYTYSGLAIGDFCSVLLSQWLQSRKRALLYFMIFSSLFNVGFYSLNGITAQNFYFYCFCMGVFSGYWALFATVAAESFGTNLRATVATTVPNFVRGSLVPISLIFETLQPWGLLQAGLTVSCLCVVLSFLGLYLLKDTYSQDLNFYETH